MLFNDKKNQLVDFTRPLSIKVDVGYFGLQTIGLFTLK